MPTDIGIAEINVQKNVKTDVMLSMDRVYTDVRMRTP